MPIKASFISPQFESDKTTRYGKSIFTQYIFLLPNAYTIFSKTGADHKIDESKIIPRIRKINLGMTALVRPRF